MNKFTKLKSLNVLYIEDDIDVREEVEDLLRLKVGILHVAKNGQDGLEKYQQYNPDIIITDIKMPVMDGMTMIEKIRSEDISIPIIITSAFNDTEFFKSAIDLHVDKYIIKPINIMQLFEVLDRAALVIYQTQELQHKDAILKNKEKISAIGELLENIAHQWRQPLSMISTSASSLQMQKDMGTMTDKTVEEMCENINNSAQDLSKIIDRFAKLFTDKGLREVLNLKEIIENYYNMIKTSFRENGITLICRLNDVSLLATQKDIVQILFTLFSNAKDILLINSVKDKVILIELFKNNDKIICSVQDSGGGIEEKNISKIFDPYFTTKHQSQGTGLGLYLVYEIVHTSLNGEIEVTNDTFTYENNDYYGAKFTITL